MGITPSTCTLLSRQWAGDLRWKPRWHRRHASKPRVTQQHAHSALFCYDVLIEVFAAFDLNDWMDVTACARSAQVCLAWSGPASETLWTSCSGRSLKDLDYLLRAIDVEIPGSKLLLEVRKYNVLRMVWSSAVTGKTQHLSRSSLRISFAANAMLLGPCSCTTQNKSGSCGKATTNGGTIPPPSSASREISYTT